MAVVPCRAYGLRAKPPAPVFTGLTGWPATPAGGGCHGHACGKDIAARPASKRVTAVTPFATPVLSAADPSIVRPIVSRHLGIARHEAGLISAISELLPLAEQNGPASDPAIVGLAIAVFAALRRESRGAHFRNDFPERTRPPQGAGFACPMSSPLPMTSHRPIFFFQHCAERLT